MTAHRFVKAIEGLDPVARWGTLRRIRPTALEADGPAVALGTLCMVGETVAEVVKVDVDHIALVPFGETARLAPGMRVRALSTAASVPVGDAFLGRAIDALAAPIDGAPVPLQTYHAPLFPRLPEPLDRTTPSRALQTGIRAIDGLLTLGIGQRIGIFAASGVGKTSLIAQLARQIEADHTILCLVGERGREVEQLWETEIDLAARANMTLVAATSDKSAALRVRAIYQALALAEHWRTQGRHVLLILDSATRLSMAMRETGLASGEPPTLRAYPPSVFAAIPKIVERCGALRSGGAITAIFTVLSETDDVDDPISEMMKSVLDGHIVLSRALAERGHFPAIEVTRSVSRNWHRLVTPEHLARARQVLALLADHEASRALIESGLYAEGSNPALDAAIAVKPHADLFLTQRQEEHADFDATLAWLLNLPVTER